MPPKVFNSGSKQQLRVQLWGALLLALFAAFFSTRSAQAAPPAQPIDPCNVPGIADIIDPAGGSLVLRMTDGVNIGECRTGSHTSLINDDFLQPQCWNCATPTVILCSYVHATCTQVWCVSGTVSRI